MTCSTAMRRTSPRHSISIQTAPVLGYGNLRSSPIGCRGRLLPYSGAGKSVLAAVILRHLLDLHQLKEVGISYLFCRHDSGLKNSSRELKSVLLRQLIMQVPQVPDLIKSRYDAVTRYGSSPIPLKTIDALLVLVCRSFKGVFVIFDGLDECDDRVWTSLLDLIPSLKTSLGIEPHVLVTTFDTKERNSLAGHSVLVQADAHDVRVFLGDFMPQLPPDLEADIVQTVITYSNGM